MNKIYVFTVIIFFIIIGIFYFNLKQNIINLNIKLDDNIKYLNIKLDDNIKYLNEFTIDDINQELDCIEKDLDYLFGVGDACEKSFPGE